MASKSRSSRPTIPECDRFANCMYRHIWRKFNVLYEFDHDPIPESEFHSYVVSQAVMCEQLIARQFYKEHLFVSKVGVDITQTDHCIHLCIKLCDRTKERSFFHRILRYSALIAEFFLCKADRVQELELIAANRVWTAVFKDVFMKDFVQHNGWQGLRQYSAKYCALYSELDEDISSMFRPYEDSSISQLSARGIYVSGLEVHPDKAFNDLYRIFLSYSTLPPDYGSGSSSGDRTRTSSSAGGDDPDNTRDSFQSSESSNSSSDPTGLKKELQETMYLETANAPPLSAASGSGDLPPAATKDSEDSSSQSEHDSKGEPKPRKKRLQREPSDSDEDKEVAKQQKQVRFAKSYETEV